MLKICRRVFTGDSRAKRFQLLRSRGREFSNIHREIELLLEGLEEDKAAQEVNLKKRKEQEIDTFMMKVTSLLSTNQLASKNQASITLANIPRILRHNYRLQSVV